ncbi:hypothetical protein OEB96_26840 [Paraliomyxa miuraensis]|nr:hypothetical protein [Paraliomyxa miuraensis]
MERVIVVGCVGGLVGLVAWMLIESHDRGQPRPIVGSDRAPAGPKPNEPPPGEPRIDTSKEERSCETALPVVVSRCDVKLETCKATNFPTVVSLPTERVLLLGAGHFVTFGGHFEWFVSSDGQVLTANGAATMACPGMPNIDDRIRAAALGKARVAPEGSAGCTMTDIEHARALDRELPQDDVSDRAERAAFKRAAKARKVSVKAIKAAWYKVAAECPDAL